MAFLDLARRSDGVMSAPGLARLNVVGAAVFLACVGAGVLAWRGTGSPLPIAVTAVIGLVLMQSPQVAQQWERGVLLKLGRFVGLRGPGLFWIVPFVHRVSSWIDQRTIT